MGVYEFNWKELSFWFIYCKLKIDFFVNWDRAYLCILNSNLIAKEIASDKVSWALVSNLSLMEFL